MRVLFLTHRVPFAPNRGDRIRAFHILQTLESAPGVTVDVVSLTHSPEEALAATRMARLGRVVSGHRVPQVRNRFRGVAALLGAKPLTHVLLDSPTLHGAIHSLVAQHPPDVVLAYCSGMARFALEPPLNRFPLVIDLVDVDSAKWADMADRSTWPRRWVFAREARCLAQFERVASERAVTTLVVTPREADLLRLSAPQSRIDVVPNGVDLGAFSKSAPERSAKVVFCGVMNYAPNVEGVVWFAREVWPLLRASRPDATFTIVGSEPSAAVSALASPALGIAVTGAVPDVRPYLRAAAVSVAPLTLARGVQNKVLEALATGLPVVATTQVAAGLPASVLAGCRVADEANDFARHAIELLSMTPSARRDEAERANLSGLAWSAQLAPLEGILRSAAASRRP